MNALSKHNNSFIDVHSHGKLTFNLFNAICSFIKSNRAGSVGMLLVECSGGLIQPLPLRSPRINIRNQFLIVGEQLT